MSFNVLIVYIYYVLFYYFYIDNIWIYHDSIIIDYYLLVITLNYDVIIYSQFSGKLFV